jgi:hypothetical protein
MVPAQTKQTSIFCISTDSKYRHIQSRPVWMYRSVVWCVPYVCVVVYCTYHSKDSVHNLDKRPGLGGEQRPEYRTICKPPVRAHEAFNVNNVRVLNTGRVSLCNYISATWKQRKRLSVVQPVRPWTGHGPRTRSRANSGHCTPRIWWFRYACRREFAWERLP